MWAWIFVLVLSANLDIMLIEHIYRMFDCIIQNAVAFTVVSAVLYVPLLLFSLGLFLVKGTQFYRYFFHFLIINLNSVTSTHHIFFTTESTHEWLALVGSRIFPPTLQ